MVNIIKVLFVVRWGFIIHGCIDGYSRLIIYLKCETSIQAEPVLEYFVEAIERYGLPSRVRSDHGYENIMVAFFMNILRGLNRGSHITGKSVHNQRIERLWVDVYKEVCDPIYCELYDLEREHLLEVDNTMNRFCVQYVYKTVINKRLLSFQSAWNVHNLRTANNQTPRQLWLEGMLGNYNTNHTAVNEIFDNNDDVNVRLWQCLEAFGLDPHVDVINEEDIPESLFTATVEISDEQNTQLQEIVAREVSNREKYLLCKDLLS